MTGYELKNQEMEVRELALPVNKCYLFSSFDGGFMKILSGSEVKMYFNRKTSQKLLCANYPDRKNMRVIIGGLK